MTCSKSVALPASAKAWNSNEAARVAINATVGSEVDTAIHALKLAVIGVTRRLMDDQDRLPLRNQPTAVLVDGSRMSLLALELAGAAWKFGKCEKYGLLAGSKTIVCG